MKIATIIARFLLGLAFVVFGLNYWAISSRNRRPTRRAAPLSAP